MRLAGVSEAEGPGEEIRTFSATVPVKPFKTPK